MLEKIKLINFLSGAIMLASLAVAVFFLKFWRKTSDRFFAYFAAAFALLATERCFFLIINAQNDIYNEAYTSVFVFRLMAFLLIIGAILEKNRRQR